MEYIYKYKHNIYNLEMNLPAADLRGDSLKDRK
jgi:hypothetical protein